MLKAGILAAAVVVAAIVPAQASEVEVKMLTRGEAGMMVFEPAVVHVQPGDSVRFVPTDPGHNAESLPGMIPEGAGRVVRLGDIPADYVLGMPQLPAEEGTAHETH